MAFLLVPLAGSWLGLKLSGRLDEAQFRKVVLALLLLSGVVWLFGVVQSLGGSRA